MIDRGAATTPGPLIRCVAMARPVDVLRRTTLLDAVVAYLGRHGLAEASFRPMAKALGVSVNALVHHFGTKEALLAAAIRRSGEIQRAVEEEWRAEQPDLALPDLLRRWWQWSTASPDQLALVRLGIEAATLEYALDDLRRDQRGQQIEYWRHAFEDGLIDAGVPADIAVDEATIVKAVFTGLIVDLIASGHQARIDRAFDRFVQQVETVIARSAGRRRGRRTAPTVVAAHRIDPR